MSNISKVTFDQWVMIALTNIIAFSVVTQAWLAMEQTRSASLQAQLAARADERASKPTINIESSYTYPTPDSSDPIEASHYYPGFIVTNAGFVPITITSCFLETKVSTRRIQLMKISAYEMSNDTLTTKSLPHLLNRGDFFRIRYEKTDATRILSSTGVRPYCIDSLDNRFIGDWLTLK